MVLPWYIAVQRRNPDFLRVFFLEHNLERFATNRYMHEHPFWYYIPIMLAGAYALVGRRHARAGGRDSAIDRRVAGALCQATLHRSFPVGRCLSRISGSVDPFSDPHLFAFPLQAAGLHSALDSAAHHSHRRLHQSHSQQESEWMAAFATCRALRRHHHPGVAGAVAYRASGGSAASQHSGTCDFQRVSGRTPYFGRRGPLWGHAPAHR